MRRTPYSSVLQSPGLTDRDQVSDSVDLRLRLGRAQLNHGHSHKSVMIDTGQPGPDQNLRALNPLADSPQFQSRKTKLWSGPEHSLTANYYTRFRLVIAIHGTILFWYSVRTTE